MKLWESVRELKGFLHHLHITNSHERENPLGNWKSEKKVDYSKADEIVWESVRELKDGLNP